MDNDRIRAKIAHVIARHVGGEARMYMKEAEDFVDELKLEGLAVILREPDMNALREILRKNVGHPVSEQTVRDVIESLESEVGQN